MDDMESKKALVERIRAALSDRRMDIVAKETKLHCNTISNVYHGRFFPRDRTIETLSQYLFG